MTLYTYYCEKCLNEWELDVPICQRNEFVGNICPHCKEGHVKRKIPNYNFTFDMNKKIPSDLKLFLDKQKDKAKLESIVDEEGK